MVAAALAGFLLAVLWFDLMFDVQAWRAPDGKVSEAALSSISTYYRRVTIDASPMNRLVAAAMLALLAALAFELVEHVNVVTLGSLGLAVSAIGLAATRVVRRAKRLGRGQIAPDDRSRVARAILFDHVYCFGAIAALLIFQVAAT